jgi:endonuclease/exonuclease/phosphatase family metal-dependent hydrolase
MEVRIATFNIYWFPSSTFTGNQRDGKDFEQIREVIRRLDSDVIVFEEILDLVTLEQLLENVIPGRSYSLKDQAGRWAASGTGKGLKVALAFDSNKLEALDVGNARLAGVDAAAGGLRDPVAARLRPRGGGPSFMVIGVHFKSGILTVVPEPSTEEDDTRTIEVANLSEWIRTSAAITPDGLARPKNEPTILIGDFNAIRGNVSLAPLVPPGVLSTWSWPALRFASALLPDTVEINLPAKERWTTHLDKEIIDHIILSPEVKLIDGPWAYAFDYDNSWLQAAGVTKAWLETPGFTFTPKGKEPVQMENLHHITDHRPVRVTVDVG